MGRSKKQRFKAIGKPKNNKVLQPPKFKSQAQKQQPGKSTSKSPSTTTPAKKPKAHHHQQSSQEQRIPFEPHHKILLIGEADFSFSAALATALGLPLLLPTSYDSHEACLAKYATTAPRCIEELRQAWADTNVEARDELQGVSEVPWFGVDAAKIGKEKRIRRAAGKRGFDFVVWNFPHVGGLSTDVNRQVRANQALLVAFFGSVQPLLRTATASEDGESGAVMVTIFDGEPYSLWNIRDLARSTGLVVRRSGRFEAGLYPGYRHARTGGEVKRKDGEVSGTAWKGEDRASRWFEFGLPEDETKKRKDEGSSDED
jgi:25S rRNA (uracil2634-N3)-methyltransferase